MKLKKTRLAAIGERVMATTHCISIGKEEETCQNGPGKRLNSNFKRALSPEKETWGPQTCIQYNMNKLKKNQLKFKIQGVSKVKNQKWGLPGVWSILDKLEAI